MRDDAAEILFETFLQEALVSCSGMGRDIHSLALSIQQILECFLYLMYFFHRVIHHLFMENVEPQHIAAHHNEKSSFLMHAVCL